MDKKIVRLLALFAAISLLGMGYVGFRYVQAGKLIGLGPSIVRVRLAQSGGIFPDASVSYRGVEIGKVGEMRVTPAGLEVELKIDHTAPDVPANAMAVIANRSAVGEQYVDLQPTADTPPYLQDGDIIPMERTRTPVPVEVLLANLNSLVSSVPQPELRTTVDELDNAFNRSGPELQRLIDASNPLIRDAIAHLPQTTALLRDGRTVLNTQVQVGPDITSFSRDLAVFSDQLKRDDPNLRRLVAAAPPFATQLQGLIQDVGPDLGRTVANLLVVTRIADPRLAALEQILTTYPALSAAAPSVVPGDGFVHFGLVQNVNDPPPCRSGYMPVSSWRPATITDDNAPFNTDTRCNESPPINVRGSQNAPAPDGGVGGGSSPAAAATSTPQQQAAAASAPLPANGVLAPQNAPPVVIAGMSQP